MRQINVVPSNSLTRTNVCVVSLIIEIKYVFLKKKAKVFFFHTTQTVHAFQN